MSKKDPDGDNIMNPWTLHVSSGCSVMVWSVCSWNDLGPLICLDTALTGDTYVHFLADHLYPFMFIVHSDGFGQFQQDNVTPHASRIAT